MKVIHKIPFIGCRLKCVNIKFIVVTQPPHNYIPVRLGLISRSFESIYLDNFCFISVLFCAQSCPGPTVFNAFASELLIQLTKDQVTKEIRYIWKCFILTNPPTVLLAKYFAKRIPKILTLVFALPNFPLCFQPRRYHIYFQSSIFPK